AYSRVNPQVSAGAQPCKYQPWRSSHRHSGVVENTGEPVGGFTREWAGDIATIHRPRTAICHHLYYTAFTAATLPGQRPAKECPWFFILPHANAARSV
ncbi:MAG: hypothetical protein LBJ33_24790, partial [Pseudomonas putida]|nr:hypothetical protein [Pseudomonas putida]